MGCTIFFMDMAAVVSGVDGGRGLVMFSGKLATSRDDVEVESIEELASLEGNGSRAGYGAPIIALVLINREPTVGNGLVCAEGCADKVLAGASCAGGTEKAIAVIEGKD